MRNREFVFRDENNNLVQLNTALARQRKLTDIEMQSIIDAHKARVEVFKCMSKTKDRVLLLTLAQEVEAIEYKLQEHWHFEPNSNFHTWWFQVPKCKCIGGQKYDMAESNVIFYKKIDHECIIHGVNNS